MDQRKLLASILVVLAIGLHAVPVILRQGQNQTLWPFLAWAMYKESRQPGPVQADKRQIVAVTRTGSTAEVNSPLLGLSRPTIGRTFITPMMTGDSAAARRLLDRLNVGRADPFVEVRLEIERFTITDTGIVSERLPAIAYGLDPSSAR